MSKEDLNAKMKAVDAEKTKADTTFKKSENVKGEEREDTIADSESPRARAVDREKPDEKGIEIVKDAKPSNSVRKVQKIAARLADLMTGDDLEADMRVLREAKEAEHRFYDLGKKEGFFVPDHKTRLAAVQFSRAYAEGLPVARQIQLTAEVGVLDDALEKLRSSPAAMAMVEAMFKGKVEGLDDPKK